jgi:hypothetical protein
MINHKSSLTCSDGMDEWMMEEEHPCVRSLTTLKKFNDKKMIQLA